jgi:hypothetical protein
MHRAILDGVVLRKHSRPGNRLSRLKELKHANDMLMQNYRSNTVRVNYAISETQDVYLLRYFPVYTSLIENVLISIEQRNSPLFDNSTSLQVSLIGCGPCPEIVGFMRFLSNRNSDLRPVFHAFDLCNSDWRAKRKRVLNTIISDMKPQVHGYTFDLCESHSAEKYQTIFNSSHMVVIQNCLNELDIGSIDTVIENITNILDYLPCNGRFVAIETINYPMIHMVLNHIQNHARLNCDFKVELEYAPTIRNIAEDSIRYTDYPLELTESQIKMKFQARYVRLSIIKTR